MEEFLRHVPASSGLAFVDVQHLDPTHKGLPPELLPRATRMPVRQITDRTRVRPDSQSILRGVLHLVAPAGPATSRVEQRREMPEGTVKV